MANKRNKPTKLQEQFIKEQQRIKNAMGRLSKEGFEINEELKDNLIPKMPKRVTLNSLKNIKQITPKAIREELAKQPKLEDIKLPKEKTTKEKLPPPPKQPQPDPQPEFPRFEDIVIANFFASLANYPNGEGIPIIRNWINAIINEHGKEATAIMLQDGAEAGYIVTWKVAYRLEETASYITGMMEYLPEAGELTKEQIADRFDSGEFWDDEE